MPLFPDQDEVGVSGHLIDSVAACLACVGRKLAKQKAERDTGERQPKNRKGQLFTENALAAQSPLVGLGLPSEIVQESIECFHQRGGATLIATICIKDVFDCPKVAVNGRDGPTRNRLDFIGGQLSHTMVDV
jgi:hypothetical protein